jgi:hypothetical protein
VLHTAGSFAGFGHTAFGGLVAAILSQMSRFPVLKHIARSSVCIGAPGTFSYRVVVLNHENSLLTFPSLPRLFRAINESIEHDACRGPCGYLRGKEGRNGISA